MSEPKPQFAPVPVEAMPDTKLSASHWRLLVAIAWHDRMGVNGSGCYASHKTLGREAGVHFSNVSNLAGDLAKRGYIEVRRNANDRRTRSYALIYRANPMIQGRSTENFQGNAASLVPAVSENEIDGGEKHQVIESIKNFGDNILRETSNKSCEAGKRSRESTARHDEYLGRRDDLAKEIKDAERKLSALVGPDQYLRLRPEHPEIRRGKPVDRLAALAALIETTRRRGCDDQDVAPQSAPGESG